MLKIGIECESIENDSWGIARVINKLLEEIASRPELQREFKFFLYFKSKVPNYPYLSNPIFVKRIVRIPLIPKSWTPISFSLYYYVLLPIRLWFDGLNVMYFPNYMLPILFHGRSIVLAVHDTYYEARSKNIPFRYRLAYKVFITWAMKHATRLMAISEFSKQELLNLYNINGERVVVNYLGTDPQRENYHPAPHLRDYVLFVGQAFPRRHLKESLLAFEKVAHRFANLDFIIIGIDKYSPPIIEDLIVQVNERLGSKRILRYEKISDTQLHNFYAHAKALMYISSKEAFGLPPLEALAYGTYPIIADNQLSHEIFGDAAFMVKDPKSITEIADVLALALTDTAQQYRITARRKEVLETFSWSKHTDRFLQIAHSIQHA